jgi:hypothetical protein
MSTFESAMVRAVVESQVFVERKVKPGEARSVVSRSAERTVERLYAM